MIHTLTNNKKQKKMFSKSAGDKFKTVSSFARERKQPRARTQVNTIIVEKK